MAINTRYSSGCGVCLSVFHIIFGVVSCGSGVAASVYGVYLSEYGVAIWAGAWYILTGVLGLASGTRKNAVITAYYALSLISVFVAMGQMVVFSYAIYAEIKSCYDNSWDYYSSWDYNYSCTFIINNLVVCAAAGLVGFLEWIMAMSSACASCSCCCASEPQPQAQTVLLQQGMQPMALATQQVYNGQPGCSMPPPAPAPLPFVAMQPMHQAPQQVYSGQPGYSMPPPAPGPLPYVAKQTMHQAPQQVYNGQPEPQSNRDKPFSAAPVPGAQAYFNPSVDLTPEAEYGAPLPNTVN